MNLDIIISSIPVIASTISSAIVAAIAKAFVNKIGKDKDKKIENESKKNAELVKMNTILQESLNKTISTFSSTLEKNTKEISELKQKVNEDVRLAEKCDNLLDKATTIKNQLNALLKNKE